MALNIQTIPRKDVTVKTAFLPKYDYLMFFDYSQIEYRIYAVYMAQFVDDWRGVEAYVQGKDFHEDTALHIMETIGVTPEYEDGKLVDWQRQDYGKTPNFAAIYSGGTPTIQRQLGCDRKTAQILYDGFHEEYPLLGKWTWKGRESVPPPQYTLNGQLTEAYHRQGFIQNFWGRRLHADQDRKLLNRVVQGGAADLMKKALDTIDKGLSDFCMQSHLVNQVHDEVALDCVVDEVEELKNLVPTWMDDDYLSEYLPVEVDMKTTSTNWAEAV